MSQLRASITKKFILPRMVFFLIVCTNELEVLLGPKVASLSVRGKNNKIMNPAPVAMMHLLWEHPRPWVLPRVKPYKIFFCTPPHHFFLLIPRQGSQGEKWKKNKKIEGGCLKKPNAHLFCGQKHPVYKVTSKYTTKVDTVKFTLNRGSGD